METMRIQYVRQNGRKKGPKRGVLFCGIHPADDQSVIMGFSLCNKLDRFDYIDGERKSGFGLDLARKRALKWSNHTTYFIQKSWIEDELYGEDRIFYFINPNTLSKDDRRYNVTELVIEIPPSIVKNLITFIERCKRYYKDKKFPVWVNNFENGKRYKETLPIEYVDNME